MAKAATPWGQAELVEELTLAQRVGGKRFSSLVQLLEAPGGELLVRFAYATSGTARRGPVTLRVRDLIRPKTFPVSLTTAATSPIEPFGLFS